MADVQFEEGSITTSPEYRNTGSAAEVKGMAGWLARKSGGSLSPRTANVILAAFGLGMILLSIIIIWRM